MFLTTDYVTPLELTGYARASLQNLEVNQFTLSRYLQSQTIADLNFRFNRGGEGLVETGKFRGWDVEAPVMNRPGVGRSTGELPPLSSKIRLGEYTRLKQRHLTDEIRNSLLDDTERNVRALAARIELARGEALVNASVTIAENGVSATADFGRDSSMEPTVSVAWDHQDTGVFDADPIQDMLTWFDAYVARNGTQPGVILTSRQVLAQLLRIPAVRAYVYGTSSTGPAVITPVQLSQVLNAYGLPSIETYDVQVSVDGVATRVIPADRFMMLPAPGSADAAQLGKTFWGETAESLEPEFAGVEAGIVAGSYSTKDPVAVWTKASAIALPVLANPDLVLVADVLS